MPLLSDYTPAEQNTMKYPDLCRLRRQAWAAHVASMQPDHLADLEAWEAGMAKKHGPKVQVWANALPWIIALMVVRYGEAVEHWPSAYSEKDIERARAWATGTIPTGVSLVDD